VTVTMSGRSTRKKKASRLDREVWPELQERWRRWCAAKCKDAASCGMWLKNIRK
jgi:hypothetical protein